MADEENIDKNNCFYSCTSFKDFPQTNEDLNIDINANDNINNNVEIINKQQQIDIDEHYSHKKVEDYHNIKEVPIDINININHVSSVVDSQQFNNNNDPTISNIDIHLINNNMKQSFITSGNEKEIFIIEEHIPSANVNNEHKGSDNQQNKSKNSSNIDNDNCMQIISSMPIQSFYYDQSIKLQPQNQGQDNSNSNDNLKEKDNIIQSPSSLPSSSTISHFIIEQLSEKTDYIIGTYKPYQIIFYDKTTNEYEPKCERRYDNFNVFYSKIIRKYPYLILPKLSQKKISIKLITNDIFLKRRKKQLTFLINYIYKEQTLFSLPDIQRFINSIEFDENYYKSTIDEFICDLHIKNNTFNKIKSTVFGYFNPNEEIDEKQSRINKVFLFYSKITKAVKKIRDEIGTMSALTIKTAENYNDIANDLLFIRDVKPIQRNDIEFYERISTKLSKVNIGAYEDLYDKIDNFSLLLQGLVEMLKRYIEFMNRVKLIRETYQDYIKNSGNYNYDIGLIKDSAEEKKIIFEKKLFESIDYFVISNGRKYHEIIKEYNDIIFQCNHIEMIQLKTIN